MDDVFELYWKHFRTQLRTWWDRLDDNDILWIDGKREKLVTLLQAKYGYLDVECENIVRRQIDGFEQRHRNKLGSFIQTRRRYMLVLPGTETLSEPRFKNP